MKYGVVLTDTAEIGAAGASLSAIPWNSDWDAEVESEVDDALGGGTGTALTAIPWNSAWDTEVQSECADALTAYDPPTRAELTSDIAGLNDPTAAAIADAVWDEASTGHTDAGKAGAQVWTDIDAILTDTGTDGVVVASLGTTAKAHVNAEVVDALATDTYAEPGQGAPAATASLKDKIGYLYKAFRNKITQTSTALTIYADDGTTADQAATVSDDGTTFTRGEMGTGA